MSDERLAEAVEICKMLKSFVGSVRLGLECLDCGVRLDLKPMGAVLPPSVLPISPGRQDETGD